jgi:hypothetical protein
MRVQFGQLFGKGPPVVSKFKIIHIMQDLNPNINPGLTQDQNMRGHHADPIFTDAAIVQ